MKRKEILPKEVPLSLYESLTYTDNYYGNEMLALGFKNHLLSNTTMTSCKLYGRYNYQPRNKGSPFMKTILQCHDLFDLIKTHIDSTTDLLNLVTCSKEFMEYFNKLHMTASGYIDYTRKINQCKTSLHEMMIISSSSLSTQSKQNTIIHTKLNELVSIDKHKYSIESLRLMNHTTSIFFKTNYVTEPLQFTQKKKNDIVPLSSIYIINQSEKIGISVMDLPFIEVYDAYLTRFVKPTKDANVYHLSYTRLGSYGDDIQRKWTEPQRFNFIQYAQQNDFKVFVLKSTKFSLFIDTTVYSGKLLYTIHCANVNIPSL
jgi:hypothetical protein